MSSRSPLVSTVLELTLLPASAYEAMNMASEPTARLDLGLLDAHNLFPYSYPDQLGRLSYKIFVTVAGVNSVMTGNERLALVSSLYGPGNLTCWLLLLLSVVVSWTLNPRSASKDIVTNDFIAALSMPIFAVAHFFHQIHQQTGSRRGLFDLFSDPEWDNVQAVAAIEASLAVCEDFICWGAMLHFLASRKQQKMRMSIVVTIGWMCLSAELFLLSIWIPFEKSLLMRPFLFHSVPMFSVLMAWFALTAIAYLVEVTYSVALLYRNRSGQDLESRNVHGRQVLRSKRVSSWMAACTGTIAGLSTIWIKYAWRYPMGTFNSVRFVPKSTVRVSDMMQSRNGERRTLGRPSDKCDIHASGCLSLVSLPGLLIRPVADVELFGCLGDIRIRD